MQTLIKSRAAFIFVLLCVYLYHYKDNPVRRCKNKKMDELTIEDEKGDFISLKKKRHYVTFHACVDMDQRVFKMKLKDLREFLA